MIKCKILSSPRITLITHLVLDVCWGFWSFPLVTSAKLFPHRFRYLDNFLIFHSKHSKQQYFAVKRSIMRIVQSIFEWNIIFCEITYCIVFYRLQTPSLNKGTNDHRWKICVLDLYVKSCAVARHSKSFPNRTKPTWTNKPIQGTMSYSSHTLSRPILFN